MKVIPKSSISRIQNLTTGKVTQHVSNIKTNDYVGQLVWGMDNEHSFIPLSSSSKGKVLSINNNQFSELISTETNKRYVVQCDLLIEIGKGGKRYYVSSKTVKKIQFSNNWDNYLAK